MARDPLIKVLKRSKRVFIRALLEDGVEPEILDGLEQLIDKDIKIITAPVERRENAKN